MDYSKKTRDELIAICKELGIKGYSGKKRDNILELINTPSESNIQDTGKFRTNTKDQFYTNVDVAKKCINRIISSIPKASEYVWIEPSAGNGAFLHNIPSTYEKIGIDLEPKASDIIKADFISWQHPKDKKIILFGNPPFGRQSSLAKAFITKGCKFAEIIAFILPKSFTKPSMTKAFNPKYHQIYSEELEKNSFVINDTKYDVPCVFQIWQKQETDRVIKDKVEEVGFNYVKSDNEYDMAFRRVGGLAGKCYKNDGTEYSVQSHHFISFEDDNKPYIEEIMKRINAHIFPSNTVGPRSLSKSEVNEVINGIIENITSE
jgi:hypothetical protein